MRDAFAPKSFEARKRQPERSIGGRIGSKHHPLQVIGIINHFIYTAENGHLILSIQDGYVVKIEKIEKYFINAQNRDSEYVTYGKPPANHPLQEKIILELEDILFGQLVIKVTNGEVEQIEKTEKRRVNELEGAHGDGI